MKKTLVTIFISGLLSTSIFAKSHGPAGCGLGELLFRDQEGLLFNVLAATLNGTGMQTFAMSTGTLGCEDALTGKVSAVSFIEANQVALENDIARGEGETLAAYLNIIKKDVEASKLQENFSQIFTEGATAVEINENITNVING